MCCCKKFPNTAVKLLLKPENLFNFVFSFLSFDFNAIKHFSVINSWIVHCIHVNRL